MHFAGPRSFVRTRVFYDIIPLPNYSQWGPKCDWSVSIWSSYELLMLLFYQNTSLLFQYWFNTIMGLRFSYYWYIFHVTSLPKDCIKTFIADKIYNNPFFYNILLFRSQHTFECIPFSFRIPIMLKNNWLYYFRIKVSYLCSHNNNRPK